MLTGNTSAWLEVDGKALSEFGVRIEGARGTRWVPSEAGKVFPGFYFLSASSQLFSDLRRQVRVDLWWRTTIRQAAILSLDGVMVQGEGILQRIPATRQMTIERERTSRRFLFANYEFTGQWCVSSPHLSSLGDVSECCCILILNVLSKLLDGEDPLGETLERTLGEIQVRILELKLGGELSEPQVSHRTTLPSLQVDEKLNKGLVHGIKYVNGISWNYMLKCFVPRFGDEIHEENSVPLADVEDVRSFLSFVFRYRSLGASSCYFKVLRTDTLLKPRFRPKVSLLDGSQLPMSQKATMRRSRKSRGRSSK